MRFSNAGVTIELSRQRRRRFRDLPIIPCWPPPLGRRTRPEPLTLKRLAAALLVFILGMSSSQGGRLYSIRPANGALFLHLRYGFWMGPVPGGNPPRATVQRPGPHGQPRLPHLISSRRPRPPARPAPGSGFFERNHGFWDAHSLVALRDGLGYCAVARRRHGKHEPTLADAAPLPRSVARQQCRQAIVARNNPRWQS